MASTGAARMRSWHPYLLSQQKSPRSGSTSPTKEDGDPKWCNPPGNNCGKKRLFDLEGSSGERERNTLNYDRKNSGPRWGIQGVLQTD
jgi:hypothetical protein